MAVRRNEVAIRRRDLPASSAVSRGEVTKARRRDFVDHDLQFVQLADVVDLPPSSDRLHDELVALQARHEGRRRRRVETRTTTERIEIVDEVGPLGRAVSVRDEETIASKVGRKMMAMMLICLAIGSGTTALFCIVNSELTGLVVATMVALISGYGASELRNYEPG